MASSIRTVTIDCSDTLALAGFWAQALGWHVFFDDDPEVVVAASFPQTGDGPTLLFIPVPEGKTAKNRVHLDVEPTDRTRDEEVERLVGLGATQVEDHRTADGMGWVWLADPEGNEFCVVRSRAERAAGDRVHAYRIEERPVSPATQP